MYESVLKQAVKKLYKKMDKDLKLYSDNTIEAGCILFNKPNHAIVIRIESVEKNETVASIYIGNVENVHNLNVSPKELTYDQQAVIDVKSLNIVITHLLNLYAREFYSAWVNYKDR